MVPVFLTIVEAGRLIERKELSPIELIESRIDRITRLDGSLNSFVCVLAEQALAEARTAEAEITSGHYRGPLPGIPIGLKDLYETGGGRDDWPLQSNAGPCPPGPAPRTNR